MGEKRLDFDAPLLSVRRIAAKKQPTTKTTVGNPGVVPFTWEQVPGKPKGLEKSKIDEEKAKETGVDEDIVDGADTFSRTDSSLDCSVSGYSGSVDADGKTAERFSKDPEVCKFMIGRFLPAAKAMAMGPLVPTAFGNEKEGSAEEGHGGNHQRSAVRLPYQHRPATVTKFGYDRQGEEEENSFHRHFSRACGLLSPFCFKNVLPLLNPSAGLRVNSDLSTCSWNSFTDHGSIARSADESWDAVYKHKVGNADDHLEYGSKLTSESNPLTCWSDSQTLDESSCHRSPQSPFHEEKGLLVSLRRELKGRKTVSFDFGEVVGEKHSSLTPCHGKRQGFASMSPSINKTLTVDSMPLMGSPCSNSSLSDALNVNREQMRDHPVLDADEKDGLLPKICVSAEAGLLYRSERSSFGEINSSNDNKPVSKLEDKDKNSTDLVLPLLPPPLPNSPTESWLERTLQSASSKHPSSQVKHRKRVSWAPSKDYKCTTDVRILKQKPRQTRFAQVLTEPSITWHE